MAASTGPSIVKDNLIFEFDAGSTKVNRQGTNQLAQWPWTISAGSETGYNQNGDGNSRITDVNPFGLKDIVWDVSDQDATSNADGGWNTSSFPVDKTKMYRYSVWIRRKVIGNGFTYFGLYGLDASDNNVGVTYRSDGTTNSTNPYFWAGGWTADPSEWILLVAHVWPVGTAAGGNHPDSGRWRADGSKLGSISKDMIWHQNTERAKHRTYLYYSTNTSTNQQFYAPRVDICDGTEPSLYDLLNNVPNNKDLIGGRGIDNIGNTAIKPSEGTVVFPTTSEQLIVQNMRTRCTFDSWFKCYSYQNSYNMWMGRLLPYFSCRSSGSWFVSINISGQKNTYFTSGDGELNKWYNVTTTLDYDGVNTTVKIYVNGELKANSTYAGEMNNASYDTNDFSIGDGRGTTDWYPFNGEVPIVRIYDRPLTANEVKRNFAASRHRFGV